jgi:hypothetical protein
LFWFSSMRLQLWHQLVTSGYCATHLFWRMVVLWYVALCKFFLNQVSLSLSLSNMVQILIVLFIRSVRDLLTTPKMVQACHLHSILWEQKCCLAGILLDLVKEVDQLFM